MATTGFILAPCHAGNIPLTRPITLEITIPTIILCAVSVIEKSPESEMAVAPRNTISNPIIPPAIESIRDSKRN